MDSQRVVVAEILRPRGNKGELMARSQTDVSGRLENLREANVALAGGKDLPVSIERAWPHKSGWVLKFGGVDSIDAAEKFRGGDLWVPFESRGQLAEGEVFRSDLLGCGVFDRSTGQSVGTVSGWQEYGGPLLLEVASEGKESLVPFVRSQCDVDLAKRRLVVDLPEGLLDL